jgi:hypothetical protein
LATITPAVDDVTGVVFGTQGIGLTLRTTPGGAEIGVLPEGTVVTVLEGEAVAANGFAWRLVRTAGGEEGWVAVEFLDMGDEE